MPAPPARPLRSTRVLAVLAVAGMLLPACEGAGDGAVATPGVTTRATPAPGTAVGIADPDDIDPGRLEPLAGLPPCPSPEPPAEAVDAGDLPLPEQALVATASTDGPLRTAQGFSPRTPVEIMVGYLRQDELEVVAAEDEVFESEVLLADGHLRVFVKSQAACDRGSAFVVFASTDPQQVPTPAGTTPAEAP